MSAMAKRFGNSTSIIEILLAKGFENSTSIIELLCHSNYSVKDDNSSNLEKGGHAGATEGGVLSGHGPLDTPLACFLVQAVIIIGLSRFLHVFLHKLRQPRVIAEIIGGICLGPSVLGNIPGFTNAIFPKASLGFLSTVSNIGLVFYLFLVGLELDPQAFFNHIRRSLAISLAGIVLPFALGVACSWGLYSNLLDPNDYYPFTTLKMPPFTSFLLFTGVAISITAFPVLARILTETKLLNTPVGLVAISAAAIDDAIAWTLLALVISILNATNNLTALYVFLLAFGYAFLLLLVFRPLLGRLFNRFLAKSSNPVSQFLVAAVFICIFLSAWITELIGVHAIFGAFLFGLIIPRGHNMAIRLSEKIEDVIIIGFLPLFFASSGLKTNIGLLNDGMLWVWLLVVIAVACFGKLFGCTITARLTGVPWREAASVGVLMNTKGLVELIVLNIGYDAHVINSKIFLILVIMALVTTFMTSPIIAYIYPPKYHVNITQKRTKVLSVVLPMDGIMAEKRTNVNEEQIRILVCIDELYPIPTIAKLLWLFKVDENGEDFIINTLKIVETSERSSSIMIASQIVEAIKNDPGLNMMSLFGSLINVPTRNFMALSPVNEVSEEVTYIANSEECNLIVLPWFSQSVFGSILSSSPQEKIKSIVTTATATTAVYVPEQVNVIGSTGVPKSILVPFFGGADDREAVKIALRFYRHNGVKVTIMKVDYVSNHQSKTSKISIASMNAHYKAHDLHIQPQFVEDIALIDEVQRAAAMSKDQSLIYKCVESTDLITSVIDECRISRFDLVVAGRNYEVLNERLISSSYRNIAASVNENGINSKPENGHINGRPTLFRSQSEIASSLADSTPQRRLSIGAELSNSNDVTHATNPENPVRNRPTTIVTEILGKLGQSLSEAEITSVLVVHRNNFIHL